jgi:pimeloyl-ACP methyl ester carboxylesterase
MQPVADPGRLPWEPTAQPWHERCANDPALQAIAAGVRFAFGVRSDDVHITFSFRDGVLDPAADATEVAFSVCATTDSWRELFAAVPRPTYQNFFGMLMRVEGTSVSGDQLAFAQHVHVVRRVLELGRGTTPPEAEPPAPSPTEDHVRGRFHHVTTPAGSSRVLVEESGSGPDVLLLHTAGADGRQFHHLMNDERLRSRCHMVSFDLPGHGRSAPPSGVHPGGYALDTDAYVDWVMGVVDATGLDQPIVLGCSMSGALCLELAYRFPDRLGGVVACEASEKVLGRQVPWARHPLVNQTLFVPEWVDGLMAPQSPARYREEIWWGYSQGGFGTFYGDILFYSGEWDGRDRVPHIDTRRCPVVMLTGEYDYSCTPQMSEQTAARIPGAEFRTMRGLGHFPPAENPPLFAGHLLDALDTIAQKVGAAS